jgi:predicted nucleic acid-binding protein
VIVLDASAAVEWLLRLPLAGEVDRRLGSSDRTLHAPHLIDIEVAQVVRRFANRGAITADRGAQALVDLADLDLNRYEHTPLLPLIWDLRDNLTSYDAAYVALAVSLEASLLTMDAKLTAAPLPGLRVELIS